MNYPYEFEAKTAIEIILYIAHKVAQPTFHTISKMMYFADKAHLEKYGRFICHDNYVAMKHGPVPSDTYHMLKVVRGDSFIPLSTTVQASNAFTVQDKSVVKARRPANFDYLSQSVLECLDNAITQYGHLSFSELTELSHDTAWESADENDCIEIEQIAATLANSEDLLEYLSNPHP
jgi:uncharacterized phage-associated protein